MSSSALTAEAPDLSSGVFTDTTPHDVAVSVRGLSKSYSIAKNAAKHTTVREAMMHKVLHPFETVERDTFWALNDVSFDIQQGDVVGIIGRNGAGKSTLLKILSRITEPTKGRIDLYGRVGSLLEVGTGFHPELTGRENIFLNGAILGMKKSEIARQFDAIVEFAEVSQFLDTPVKRYSSGMYVRLAFAVAAHLNPEILIVDEVLAVGDAAFQTKCLGKMQEVAKQGRTVLFVSHDMTAVIRLCRLAILLEGGSIKDYDKVSPIVDKYLLDQTDQDAIINLALLPRTGQLRNQAQLVSTELINTNCEGFWTLPFGKSLCLRISFRVDMDLNTLEIGPSIFSAGGFEIASSLSSITYPWTFIRRGSYCVEIIYTDLALLPGFYRFNIGLRSDYGMEDYLSNAFSFEIITSELAAKKNVGTFSGAVLPTVQYDLLRLDELSKTDAYRYNIDSTE